MRITGGDFKGRVISSPNTPNTRPMTDKVKAALFDTLGPIEGLIILDAYAGSGALGFEALSRGAQAVTAVESARLPSLAIIKNSKALGVGSKFTLFNSTIKSFLRQPGAKRYDVIIADPPYAEIDKALLVALAGVLKAGGILIISHDSKNTQLELRGLEVIVSKVYGGAALTFYRQD